MSDDISTIEAWAKNFADVKSLAPTLTKHFLLHKKAIEADIATLKTDANDQEWFATGEEIADIVTILLPMPEAALF